MIVYEAQILQLLWVNCEVNRLQYYTVVVRWVLRKYMYISHDALFTNHQFSIKLSGLIVQQSLSQPSISRGLEMGLLQRLDIDEKKYLIISTVSIANTS